MARFICSYMSSDMSCTCVHVSGCVRVCWCVYVCYFQWFSVSSNRIKNILKKRQRFKYLQSRHFVFVGDINIHCKG